MRTYISLRPLLGLLGQGLVLLATSATLYAGQNFHIATGGSDNNGNGSSSSPWRTLKKACLSVPANQGHTIVMGSGLFYDSERFDSTKTPATLPQNVSLRGQGKTSTSYFGRINVPQVYNQTISDFFLDGRENQEGTNGRYFGLMIEFGSGLTVEDLRLEGFHGSGLRFGKWDGLSNSVLRNCELINLGAWNSWSGFGSGSGNLKDCEIYGNTFREERGKGWNVWNSGGGRTMTRVKIHHNTFHTHGDTTYGWNNQQPFNFEWVNVDAIDCEIYQNSFNGIISLVKGSKSQTANKPNGSIRIWGNRWDYTIRYAIEAGMGDMEIDHNYMHFDIDPSPDKGNGYGAILQFGTTANHNMLIHHNVIENVPKNCIFNLTGNNVRIYNNTATTGSLTSVPGYLKSHVPSFIFNKDPVARQNWDVRNNVFLCDSTRVGRFFDTGSAADPIDAVVSNNIHFHSNNGWSGHLWRPIRSERSCNCGSRVQPFRNQT